MGSFCSPCSYHRVRWGGRYRACVTVTFGAHHAAWHSHDPITGFIWFVRVPDNEGSHTAGSEGGFFSSLS